jgi:hypothetical protein
LSSENDGKDRLKAGYNRHCRTEVESWRDLQTVKHRIYNEATAGTNDAFGAGKLNHELTQH